jgi:hypothetical protein
VEENALVVRPVILPAVVTASLQQYQVLETSAEIGATMIATLEDLQMILLPPGPTAVPNGLQETTIPSLNANPSIGLSPIQVGVFPNIRAICFY